jgi:hypothetical protein
MTGYRILIGDMTQEIRSTLPAKPEPRPQAKPDTASGVTGS